jgi:hypothetical protein
MNKELIKQIKSWLKDWKATQPQNLDIDNETFEGGAYNLLSNALAELKRYEAGKGGKLYYHKTDGGAEYLCTKPVKGTDEGDLHTTIIRLDGGATLI